MLLICIFRAQNISLTQVKEDLSSVEVILGQLVITGFGVEVFDYLPNLMYIGGFEGETAIDSGDFDALEISDNTISANPTNVPFNLTQIHFPKLVGISTKGAYLVNNPFLCYIGLLDYYITPPNLTLEYGDMAVRPYSECGKQKQPLLQAYAFYIYNSNMSEK